MSRSYEALAQSVKARLVNRAHEEGVEPNLLLSRFALERILYRISVSSNAESFVLKGAMLLLVWFGETVRPTRDADLLGFGDLEVENLAEIFRDFCVMEVEPDGMRFDASSVEVRQIRRDDPYGGHRVTLLGYLGTARLKVQLDIGIGDALVPRAEWLEYPTLLDHPAPRIRAYRPETTVAEKLHAMVTLGRRTSRLRDFFDVWLMAGRLEFDSALLAESIQSTFERRGTEIPSEAPVALTPTFASSPDKRTQWHAFLRKSGLGKEPHLEEVVSEIAVFLLPLLNLLRGDRDQPGTWPPGGPWMHDESGSS